MDQAERDEKLSGATPEEISGDVEANFEAENLNDPPTDQNSQEETGAEKEENVTGAVFAARPFAGAFSINSGSAETPKAVATAPVNPALTEANREEEAIVARVLGGDTEAFSELIDRYKVAVYNLCARMLHDPTEAEDAAQEVFVQAYTQLHSYQPGRRFSTWILSLASHDCI